MLDIRPIKLGIIVRDFKIGGCQRFISHLTSVLNKSKFQIYVTILDNKEIDFLSAINPKDCKSIQINPYYKNNPYTIFWLNERMQFMDINISFILRADVLAGCCAKLFNINNLIITERGGRIKRTKGYLIRTIMRLIDKYIVSKNCQSTISNSEIGKQALINDGFNYKNIKIIPNGIKCDYEKKIGEIKKNGHINIGYLGRLERIKNINIIIKSLAQLEAKKFRLIIGGIGPEENNLKNMIKEHNLMNRVNFVGAISNLEEFFKSVDIGIIPSSSESFPNILLEHWKYNVPVIMSDIRPFKDITVGMKYTVLFKNNDKDELTSKILLLASNIEFRMHNVNEANNVMRRKYDIVKIIKQYEEYFINQCQ